MATYVFKFPAAAAGKAVTVRNAAGATVDTGTVGAASGVQGSATYSVALASGTYVAEAADAAIFFSSRATGVVDIEAAVVGLPAQAAFVANASTSSIAACATSVNALRDALIAAGLMAAS
jgi:hypothetical protein